MDIIAVDAENIDREHICCAITDKKGETCVSSKKAWMKQRFEEGLVFRKLDVRGKVFIEYIPAENAWAPIVAPGYMYIHCFWVSGQYKGKGYANQLLEQCIEDSKAKGKVGLVTLSSKKKQSFLSDPKYLKYKGFQVADEAMPMYELLYLPFEDGAAVPRFADQVKVGTIDEKGFVLFYSNQCPHTDKYAPLLQEWAKKRHIDVKLVKLESAAAAQGAPTPFTTYSLFYGGNLVTHEILSEKRFEKLVSELGV